MSRLGFKQRASDPFWGQDGVRVLSRLKLQHVALILVTLALLLYAYEEKLTDWRHFPYLPIADTLLTTAIVVLAFEWFLRRENEARLSRIVGGAVHNEVVPLTRRFFSEPQDVLSSLNESALDEVIGAALGIRLEDASLATEVDDGLLRAIAKYRERWTDAHFTVTLTRIQDHPSPQVRHRYFDAYVSLRFTTVLKRAEFPVWVVTKKKLFDQILWGDDDFFYAWLQPSTPEFPTVSEASFEVDSIVVNGTRLGTCTGKTVDEQRMLIVCRDEFLNELLDQPVIVEATFKVKVPKRAHAIHLSVTVPTRGVVMTMHYDDTDIQVVEVVDMFVSRRRPDIRGLPTSVRPRGVEIEVREWTFPKGGVVFVWHLAQEQDPLFNGLLSRPDSPS